MTPVIRGAAAEDRPALVDLWVRAWQAAMPAIDFASRRDWIAAHLDELEQAGAVVMVATDDSRPAGFVTVDETGHVDQLVVAVDCQGVGVGQALMAAARARSAVPLRLSVNADNQRALRFYQRQGFAIVGRGSNPQSGLPVLHMETRA